MLSKILIRREARKILKGLRRLDNSEDIGDDLARWERAARSLIREVYREDSGLIKKLDSPLLAIAENHQRMIQVMEDFLSTIQSTGLPFGYRAPRSKWLISHLLTFFLTCVVTFGATFWGFKLSQSAQAREERYKVTEVEFYHWYRNLRWQYQQGLDSIFDITIQTMGYRAGQRVIRDKWLEFAESFEKQIDKTLDSFLMEYTVQGGDTLTLHYKRKPLGNLPQKLRNSPAFKR